MAMANAACRNLRASIASWARGVSGSGYHQTCCFNLPSFARRQLFSACIFAFCLVLQFHPNSRPPRRLPPAQVGGYLRNLPCAKRHHTSRATNRSTRCSYRDRRPIVKHRRFTTCQRLHRSLRSAVHNLSVVGPFSFAAAIFPALESLWHQQRPRTLPSHSANPAHRTRRPKLLAGFIFLDRTIMVRCFICHSKVGITSSLPVRNPTPSCRRADIFVKPTARRTITRSHLKCRTLHRQLQPSVTSVPCTTAISLS